jgi:hypothetical protein
MKKLFLFCCSVAALQVVAQPERWQQKVNYQINVNMDVATNRLSGTEKIDYWNNSPDTLYRIFIHLY